MTDSGVERLKRRDELLQVLFWLEGEGFEAEMHAEGVRRFLHWPAEDILLGLEELVEDGYAVRVGRAAAADDEEAAAGAKDEEAARHADDVKETPAASAPLRLTQAGRTEGGRRFVSEFATMLSRDTHHGGECHDPECDCHELGPAACTAFPRERD